MSTVQRPGEKYVDFDEYIEYQLDKARNGIKWTDILAAAAGISALVIGYLVVFVAADHWAFEGGVPRTLRIVLLGLVAAIAAGWIGWKIVRPYLRRVNDLYAARMLEESEPGLRGSLFGLIDARRGGRPPADEVRRALEKRAATTLADVDPDSAVDRRPLMRTAYVLLGVVLVACAYAVFSPKRVGPSLLRALVPSSAVGVATRTEILSVKPGDAAVLAGSTLDVSVTLRGETPDRVMLFFGTVDRRFADEPVELRLHDETTREYRAALVGDAGRGLSQDLTYRIEANDDAAGPFAVEVEQPPTATVTSVALRFPPYTRLEPTVRDAPPIDAIEGTNVTVTATANRPIKAAKLAFADDEKFATRAEEVSMRIGEDGVTLTASWKLQVRSDDTTPTFYRIECRDTEGKSNPNPAVYPLAIRKDKAPEVVLHDPQSDLERPANAVVPLAVTARDPDFLLREVTLRLEKNGQELPERNVLWEGTEREVGLNHDWNLADLALKPGDVVSYYVQARDNREPEFNRRNTPKLNVTITEPVSREEVDRQLAEDRKKQEQELAAANENDSAVDRPEQQPGGEVQEPTAGDQNQEQRPQDQPAEADQPQEPGAGEEGAEPSDPGVRGEDSDSRVPNDGSRDDEVISRLLERQREEEQQQREQPSEPKQGEQSEDGEASESQGGGNGQSGDNGRKGQGSGRPNEKRQPGGESNAEPSDGAGEGTQNQQGNGQNGSGNRSGSGTPKTRSQQNQTGEDGEDGSGNGTQDTPIGSETDAASDSAPTDDRKQGPGTGRKNAPNDGESTNSDDSPQSEDGEPGKGTDATSGADAEPSDRNDASEGTPDGEGGPDEDMTPSGAAGEGGRGETETRPPQEGDAPQASRQGEGPTPPNAASGERTGEQPRSFDGDPNSEPTGSDDERSSGDPGRPNADGQPPGPGERNPGEGRPDQRSDSPDVGEGGTGQPNVDGTPDGEEGPGDAGTQPGDRQTADRPTGRQGPGRDGRPDKTGTEKAAAQRTTGNPQDTAEKPTEPMSAEEAQPGDPQGEGDQQQLQQPAENRGQRSGQQQTEQRERQPGSQRPSREQSGRQRQQGEGQQGEGQQGEGQQGEGQQGEGQQGEGQQGEGQQGEGQQGKSGKGQAAGKGGKGEQGGQPGASGTPSGKGGNGQPGMSGQGGHQSAGGGGGTPGDAAGGGAGGSASEAGEAGSANADYAKQATDLVLKKLEDELKRGEVDEELLKELGWTKEDAERFAERLRKNLSAPTGDETPQDLARRKEFEHMLESLSIENAPGDRGARAGRVNNVKGVGTKNPAVPSEYRDAWESFTRSVAGRRAANGNQK